VSILENLRRKSEAERRSVALILAAVITVIIFLIWLSVFLSNSPAVLKESAESASEFDDVSTSLSTLKEKFFSFFGEAEVQLELQEEPVPERGAVGESETFEESFQEENVLGRHIWRIN